MPLSRVLIAAFVAAGLLSACSSDNELCSKCPKVDGTYLLSSGAVDRSCDGGREPPNLLVLSQVGSSVSAQVEGATLSGNVYDTFDVTLAGDFPKSGDAGFVEHLDWRARFVEGGTDGGAATLHGTWTFTPGVPPGTAVCSETRQVTGTRQ